jgi:hypothetical protein
LPGPYYTYLISIQAIDIKTPGNEDLAAWPDSGATLGIARSTESIKNDSRNTDEWSKKYANNSQS